MGKNLRDLLLSFKNGEIDLDEIEKQIKLNYFEEIEDKLKLDINRQFRTGVPEVVYGRGKDVDEIIKATLKLAEKNGIALATKIDNIEKLANKINNYNLKDYDIKINKKAKTLIIKNRKANQFNGILGFGPAGTNNKKIIFNKYLINIFNLVFKLLL